MSLVIVEVREGMAECCSKPKGIKLVIIDYDLMKRDNCYEPQVYEHDKTIVRRRKRREKDGT